MEIAMHPYPTNTMRQSREIKPGMQFNSPHWMTYPLAIPLNSAIPVDSVVHLIPNGPDGRRYGPIPTPAELQGPSRALRNLRRDGAWKYGGTRDDQVAQMDVWFPDVPRQDSTPEPEEEDVTMSDLSIYSPAAPSTTTNIDSTTGPPSSDIGIFATLPGEIRNRIYRFAVLEPESKPVAINLEPKTCSMGACLHNKVSFNLPGIASTCRQLRWEAAPIFLAENVAFQFDDGVVQQCCVSNYLRTLGSYVDLIPQFNFLLKRPIWNFDQFVEYATYTFVLTPPKGSNGEFSLEQWEAKDRDICQCQLDDLVTDMNRRKDGVAMGGLVQEFVDSEEFADFVWRTRKTKQWTVHLEKCVKCKKVVFNN